MDVFKSYFMGFVVSILVIISINVGAIRSDTHAMCVQQKACAK